MIFTNAPGSVLRLTDYNIRRKKFFPVNSSNLTDAPESARPRRLCLNRIGLQVLSTPTRSSAVGMLLD
jgi:hypothetical protein